MSTDKTWISLDAFEEAFARQDAELESLRQENSRLREALEFYADHENYHAIAFLFDRPCGAFADDFSAFPIAGYNRSMPGVRAREALNPPKS